MRTALWILGLAAFAQDRAPSEAGLRAAIESLRHGAPGEPAFDEALAHLPTAIRSCETDLVAGGAYLAGMHGRAECASALLDTFDAWEGIGTTAHRSVLDALIRLDVRLEPGRLPPSRWC